MTLPIGAICYAIATACAAAVARGDRSHAPIVDTLGAAALHAALAPHIEPRHALALWLAVPASAGVAYLRAFDVPLARYWGAVCVAGAVAVLVAPRPSVWWTAAIWGPLIAAALLGVAALAFADDRTGTLTRRVALALIVSDLFGLVCAWRWPGVMPLQARAAALAVAALHAPEIMRGSRSVS